MACTYQIYILYILIYKVLTYLVPGPLFSHWCWLYPHCRFLTFLPPGLSTEIQIKFPNFTTNSMAVRVGHFFKIHVYALWPWYHTNITFCYEKTLYRGWLKFFGVPIFVVFEEGMIKEFQYPWNGNFLYELWKNWKYYGHGFWTPWIGRFCLIHENWYPRK